MIIDLLRHGEVEWDAAIARGCGSDMPLTERGWQQMLALAGLRDGMDTVASSPLRRCRAFAEAFAGQAGAALAILPDMREIDFGAWEGKGEDQIAERELLQQFWQDPSAVVIPGGESFADFEARVWQSWQAWMRHDAGERRLLVAHGLVLRVVLARLLGVPLSMLWRLHLPYAAWCRLTWTDGEPAKLLFMNRVPCVN